MHTISLGKDCQEIVAGFMSHPCLWTLPQASLSYPNGTNICNYKDIRNCKDVIRYPRYTRSDILYKVIRYQIFKLNFGSFTFSSSPLHLWFALSFFFSLQWKIFLLLETFPAISYSFSWGQEFHILSHWATSVRVAETSPFFIINCCNFGQNQRYQDR